LAHAVTYTINYFNATNHHPTTSLAHAWSLGVEEQFYILWPLAFVILAARGRRAMIVGVSVAALAGIAWRSWLILGAHVDPAYVYNAFETRYDNLAIGCLLALTLDYSRVLAIAEWCGKRVLFSMVTLTLLLTSRVVLPSPYHYSLGFTIDALLVAVLIVQVLQLYQTRVWSWLEWRTVRYIGAISYPMYLYHAWGGSIARRVPGNIHVKFAAGVLATIVLASGSYYLIERPALKLRPRRAREPGIMLSPQSQTQPPVVFLSAASPGI
jgi:peptidoglycan/LPS O-acetylase OafA/YrhL